MCKSFYNVTFLIDVNEGTAKFSTPTSAPVSRCHGVVLLDLAGCVGVGATRATQSVETPLNYHRRRADLHRVDGVGVRGPGVRQQRDVTGEAGVGVDDLGFGLREFVCRTNKTTTTSSSSSSSSSSC